MARSKCENSYVRLWGGAKRGVALFQRSREKVKNDPGQYLDMNRLLLRQPCAAKIYKIEAPSGEIVHKMFSVMQTFSRFALVLVCTFMNFLPVILMLKIYEKQRYLRWK